MIHLIVGPPCGGKSTHVAEHAKPDDTIIDFDVIARDLGSPDDWIHGLWFIEKANAEVERRIAALQPNDEAWVIRSLPDVTARAELADRLDAEVIVCDPGERVCLDRARYRPSGTRKAIRTWYWRSRR